MRVVLTIREHKIQAEAFATAKAGKHCLANEFGYELIFIELKQAAPTAPYGDRNTDPSVR
jgi:hypothetical protein